MATPIELADAVEPADLDPRVHVIVLSGRGKGFCGGYDLAAFAEQAIPHHDPSEPWDPMVDYAMMNWFTKGYASLLHANKPTVAKVHGFCVAGDCLSGAEAVEWGLAVESAPADELDEGTEVLVQRIAAMPVNQLMMVKLALNSALMSQGVHQSQLISTVFDGISRHTREGYAFAQRAADVGFRQAVRERDAAPDDDHGPSTNKG